MPRVVPCRLALWSSFLLVLVATACDELARPETPGATTLVASPAEAPDWAVPYGREFWRAAAPALPEHADARDFGGVVERVSHAIRDEAGVLRARGRTYVATFDDRGLVFSPHRRDGGGAVIEDAMTTMRVRTTRVALDEMRYDGEGAAWSVLGNTAQALLAPGVVEHYEARPEGVEVTWVVEDPATRTLAVEVVFEGLTFAGESAHGLHFADAAGDPRVRVGNAKLVDRAGREWPVAAQVDGQRVHWEVPSAALAAATFPVALDPVISAEAAIDDVLPIGGGQTLPAIASNGADYLVVWADTRSGAAIYGARVSADGWLRDPNGVAIGSFSGGSAGNPDVAWNGQSYLVVWLRHSYSFGTPTDLVGRLVSSDGQLLGGGDIAIAPDARVELEPTVAARAGEFLVVWHEPARVGFPDALYGSRITQTGDVLEPATFIAYAYAAEPVLAAADAGYLAVWSSNQSGYDVSAARITIGDDGIELPDGELGQRIATSTLNERAPGVASDGQAFFVAWTAQSGPSAFLVRGRRVPFEGALGAVTTIATTPGFVEALAVGSNGEGYLVAWSEHAVALRAVRLDDAGSLIGEPLSLGTDNTSQRWPSVASDGSDYLVAWTTAGSSSDIRGARISAAGDLLDHDCASCVPGFLITSEHDGPLAGSVASNGGEYLLMWTEFRSQGGYQVFGTRLGGDGGVLDPMGLRLGLGSTPVVASNGADWYVAWQRGGGPLALVGSRISAAGAVMQPGGTVLQEGETSGAAIASNGSGYLAVWSRTLGSFENTVFARLIDAAGDPAADAVALTTPANNALIPAVASNGDDYLVSYFSAPIFAPAWLEARAVAADGAVGEGVRLEDGVTGQLQLASDGDGYLLVWNAATPRQGGGSNLDVHGRVLGADGSPLGARFPLGSSGNGFRTAVASNGSDYLVAWGRAASSSGVPIDGQRVSAAGQVLDAAPLVLGEGTLGVPMLAYNGASDEYLVVYTTLQPSLFLTQLRLRLISAACGDGSASPSEGCDDGGLVSGDGCDAACGVEPGHACAGSPSVCGDVDECATASHECDFYATCSNTVGSYVCTCPPGYDGDGRTCSDRDECVAGTDDCHEHAECINTPGAFECACLRSFVGDGRTCACLPGYETSGGYGCGDIDECAAGTNDCHEHAECINTPGAFECACLPSFVGDGRTCACLPGYETSGGYGCGDIDECAAGTNDCHANATCTNTPGAFECACLPSFVGDGRTCACLPGYETGGGYGCGDIDECAAGTNDCHANATCTNTPGAFECACLPGWEGDGRSCADVDECAAGGDDCDANAACTNTPGAFECACLPGWEGDGRSCADVDECAAGGDDCDANAACTNTPGAFECACLPGYGGDGRTCVALDTDGDGLDDIDDACPSVHPGDRDLDHDGCEDTLDDLAAVLDAYAAELETLRRGRLLAVDILLRTASALLRAAGDVGDQDVARAIVELDVAVGLVVGAGGDGAVVVAVMRVLAYRAIEHAQGVPGADPTQLAQAIRAYEAGREASDAGQLVDAAADFRDAYQHAARAER